MSGQPGNFIRTHRRNAGLSQRELGTVIGYGHGGAVSQHERVRSLPPLIIAISYCIVLRAPLSELFAGVYESVEQVVEGRLAQLEATLRESCKKRPRHAAAARKLQWLDERRSMRNVPIE